MTIESSIPAHLTGQRTVPAQMPDGFTPPYPSFSARFDPTVERVVMAYFGVQFRGDQQPAAVVEALVEIAAATSVADGPAHWDRAQYVDEAGYTTIISILYWLDAAAWQRWRERVPSWTSPDRYTPDAGFFTEIASPGISRFETLFSSDRTEGVSVPSTGLSGEVAEHAYWGGARDRLPIAQADELAPSGAPTLVREGKLVRVVSHENICLIRSGQEWTETEGDERRMYLDDVEPALRAGMDFIRDDGRSIGCFANRYMRVLDDEGGLTDKTFGLSWWRSLADLEVWSKSHPTHLAIFGAAMKYLSTMGPAAKLRLYHEITVATADQVEFEYLGCHDQTGMLRIEES